MQYSSMPIMQYVEKNTCGHTSAHTWHQVHDIVNTSCSCCEYILCTSYYY